MSIQMYGQWTDNNSFSNVSRALSLELKRNRFDATIYGIGQLNPAYKNAYLDVGLNNTSDIGICVSYPEIAPSWLQGHHKRILVTVCETDKIPGSWVEACNTMTLVVVPSYFCHDVFKQSGVRVPIVVAKHGIWPENLISPPRVPADRDKVRFLHVSGSLSFAERKGTMALLVAFKELVFNTKPKDTQPVLYLKVPKTDLYKRILAEIDHRDIFCQESVKFLPEESYSPEEWNKLVWPNIDCVVQPSRAEGFGMVPLEARCAGVPVITTASTGHSEHFAQGVDVKIPTYSPSLLETQANPVGSAPTIKIHDIYKALEYARADIKQLQNQTWHWRQTYAKNWLWSNTLKPLTHELKKMYTKQTIKLGGRSSLRGA